MKRLVLLRHGQSEWNLQNRFTGWKDVDLSPKGVEEATQAGELMKKHGYQIDHAFTSYLTRAIRTCWLALDALGQIWVPMTKAWELNERHYGALTGLDKQETRDKHGDEQVHIWRRSYDICPPSLDRDNEFSSHNDPRYAKLSPDLIPDTESLATTLERVLPYWSNEIVPVLEREQTVIIAAHGNSIRALIKHLEGISDDKITELEIPTGDPLVYELNDDLSINENYYLREK